ncbi:MAG: hypothetical protein ACJAVN_000463 [Roseivirga sp.]|jgi:hypothetical protein
MSKTKNLKGLPNTLVQQYFSTIFYWKKGYMADWIWRTAIKQGVSLIEIDIINGSVSPKELHINPILGHLHLLLQTISNTLISNNFDADFIMKAKINIQLPEGSESSHLITCQGITTDKEGKIYQSSVYTEQAYPLNRN